MKVELVNDASILNGSSYLGGSVYATENELRTLFAAAPESNDPEIGWSLRFNGRPVSVYFKNYTHLGLPLDCKVHWHIGGFDKETTLQYARHLEECLLLLRNK